ncbi:hypothetical protein TVAG_163890 [Trichomonas vaginalis G3]|uniref:Uncharacterized protein n=1 Tax=Trichomonas vaginalis (strain ATCC PRA-98 / G3) TaxID=412133 RepID=A2DG66_TRIV3|nr:hypothetical protein TVAGG3_0954000 [Trichomonas vaginalis G3]EAY20693.1 hypothetical protein TVAG_163890 [Trichomonas vaginalis G3]KAI5487413.1 hypothetical protein TVAGG3_0954000 [Trichomonas vaginalis G3]|eukprot:XP_001581679.1 hypothetical protein [Trichomonas vaginalis G3]
MNVKESSHEKEGIQIMEPVADTIHQIVDNTLNENNEQPQEEEVPQLQDNESVNNEPQVQETEESNNDDVEKQNVTTQAESTFPTTTEGLHILVVKDDQVRKSTEPTPKAQFLKALNPSPRTISRTNKKPLKRISSPQYHMSPNEVTAICDKLLAGKKVDVDITKYLQDLLLEFSTRRKIAMQNNQYLQSKKIDDITAHLKKQFASKDLEDLYLENLQQAKDRTKQAQEALDYTKQQCKIKEQEYHERFKREAEELQQKQMDEMEEIDSKWLDPSLQRKFTKQSKVLLQQRAIEKYMVLAGELEAAEEIKKMNREAEKKESQQKFSELQSSYESDLQRVQDEHEKQRHELQTLHQFQLEALRKENAIALEVAEKRLKLAQIQEQEASNQEAFAVKKKVLADSKPIPIVTNNHKAPSIPASNPLPLPPLQVKSKRRLKR